MRASSETDLRFSDANGTVRELVFPKASPACSCEDFSFVLWVQTSAGIKYQIVTISRPFLQHHRADQLCTPFRFHTYYVSFQS